MLDIECSVGATSMTREEPREPAMPMTPNQETAVAVTTDVIRDFPCWASDLADDDDATDLAVQVVQVLSARGLLLEVD